MPGLEMFDWNAPPKKTKAESRDRFISMSSLLRELMVGLVLKSVLEPESISNCVKTASAAFAKPLPEQLARPNYGAELPFTFSKSDQHLFCGPQIDLLIVTQI